MMRLIAVVVGVAAVAVGAGTQPTPPHKPAPLVHELAPLPAPDAFDSCVYRLLADLNTRYPDQPATTLALAQTACLQNNDATH